MPGICEIHSAYKASRCVLCAFARNKPAAREDLVMQVAQQNDRSAPAKVIESTTIIPHDSNLSVKEIAEGYEKLVPPPKHAKPTPWVKLRDLYLSVTQSGIDAWTTSCASSTRRKAAALS